MIYSKNNVPKDKVVWAYMFEAESNQWGKHLFAKPYKCIVKLYEVIPLKKNGELKKSGRVSIYARMYADTEEEAIKGFDELIEGHVKFLYKIASSIKMHKIGGWHEDNSNVMDNSYSN